MSKPLENKLALVTGSSRGIGAAIAVRLAAEGASVIVNYSASPARAEAVVNQIKETGSQAEAVGADLSTVEGIKSLIASVDKAFGAKFSGRLDILVNNVGSVWYRPFLEGVDDSYDRHFNLNVRPVIELSKDAARRMVSCGWGRIINIGSIYGEAVQVPNISIFTATKFAVHGFTRALSRELGATGVTVNAVQPGFIFTELSTADGHEVMKRLTSVGRYGSYESKKTERHNANNEASLFHRLAMSSVVGRTTDRKGEKRTWHRKSKDGKTARAIRS